MNERKEPEIAIIGAGPIGCYTAQILAKEGLRTEIFEEHAEIGQPIACTGIVTKAIKELVDIRPEFLVNKLNSAEIFSQNTSIKLRLDEYVIDRYKFDNHLADLAKDNGAILWRKHKFLGFHEKEHNQQQQILVKDLESKKIIQKNPNIIIGADGPNSKVAEIINNNNNKNNLKTKTQFWIGKQGVFQGDFEKDCFQVHLGNICPGFFGWVVPENETTARIGIAIEGNKEKDRNSPIQIFDNFLRKIKKQGHEIEKEICSQAGLIPMFEPNKKLFEKINGRQYYIVGDAATQVKATTGGGLVPGLNCAKKLANSIINKTDYEKEINQENKELKMHLMLRKTLNKFSDKNFDELIKLLDQKRIKKILENNNRDSGIKLITKLAFSEPRLCRYGLKLL
ncbi:NAD(P)/FAD-dependent oxidoreductase [Candidatus Woesearchaeota archaeon]|jgi:digeranylgeranylglycerophospholipid reductase|nr:NAD(P)/FAD-dependent oxidoreductase [Candidatus Woesearchaeota archaeon]MBT5273169.1 NAD(P)/FAD-dependent oxidoreductase [Candidatus Woesearchaeota archaeon]MBT6040870.1 NAD(P)/FAD-dependent oxidoreductase [Candidatus Woesearchaeota archaeon]MBT6337516.1 NAD(P)/FAD-dependent oxidoreductase [Candidatus Woesearchaeota archaeon]MBT7927083.1 NAD(P)/FAD-dependent oxidoreductase [Candidatus Woesearchaeota archaeon]